LVPDIMFVMDYYNVIRWNTYKFIFDGVIIYYIQWTMDRYYFMELKLQICTLFQLLSRLLEITTRRYGYLCFSTCSSHATSIYTVKYLLMMYKLIQQDSFFVRCRHHQSMCVYTLGNATALMNRQWLCQFRLY